MSFLLGEAVVNKSRKKENFKGIFLAFGRDVQNHGGSFFFNII